MTPEEFKEIEASLNLEHAEFARELGVSLISVKRMATGTQIITEATVKHIVRLVLIKKEGLESKYKKLLAKYHGDTL